MRGEGDEGYYTPYWDGAEDSDVYLQKVLESGLLPGPKWGKKYPNESREDYFQRLEDTAEIFSPFRNF